MSSNFFIDVLHFILTYPSFILKYPQLVLLFYPFYPDFLSLLSCYFILLFYPFYPAIYPAGYSIRSWADPDRRGACLIGPSLACPAQQQGKPLCFYAQSTGTREAKCWSQRNVWQTIGSSLGTVAASSRIETRWEVLSCGWRWTSCSRSCGSKARGPTSFPHAPSSRSRARSRWDTHCLGDVFAISMGLPRCPKIVSIPDPCDPSAAEQCDPSADELTSRTLGPVQYHSVTPALLN